MSVQRDFVLRIPAYESGYNFISDLQKYLNTDTYKMGRLRFTGKRRTAFGGHTRKEDADTIKIYIKDKRIEAQFEKESSKRVARKKSKLVARQKAKTIRQLAQAIIDIQEPIND